MKTRWTLEEARKAAFAQFPEHINRYEIARACLDDDTRINGIRFGDLLVGFLENRETMTAWRGEGDFDYGKVTRKQVVEALQKRSQQVYEKQILDRWCSKNQIQRYQVDSAVWYEKWGKSYGVNVQPVREPEQESMAFDEQREHQILAQQPKEHFER